MNDCDIGFIGNLPVGADGSTANGTVMPKNYIFGLEHEYLSASTARILPGQCRNENNDYNIVSDSNLTADITTTGANGRNVDTAEQADKWYAFCIIAKSSDGTIAAFLVNEDDWASSYTLPSGYDKIRRIGWIRNNASSDFYHNRVITFGNNRLVKWEEVYLTTQVLTAGFATSFTDVDCSELVPPDSIVAELNMWQDGGSGNSYVTLRQNGSTNSDPAFRLWSSSFETNSLIIHQELDSSQIFEYKQFSSGPDTYIHVIGYIDRL